MTGVLKKSVNALNIVRSYLNQSTFVFGWGNITYTDEADPDSDFFISGGHIINGWGKFDVHVGAGYCRRRILFIS